MGNFVLPASSFKLKKMSRDEQLKQRWESVVNILSEKFSGGEDLDLEGIIYLIGVQELGKIHASFISTACSPAFSGGNSSFTL